MEVESAYEWVCAWGSQMGELRGPAWDEHRLLAPWWAAQWARLKQRQGAHWADLKAGLLDFLMGDWKGLYLAATWGG